MIRLVDMVVSVCTWFTNFEPVLVPFPEMIMKRMKWTNTILQSVLDSESEMEYDADTELTDEEDNSSN